MTTTEGALDPTTVAADRCPAVCPDDLLAAGARCDRDRGHEGDHGANASGARSLWTDRESSGRAGGPRPVGPCAPLAPRPPEGVSPASDRVLRAAACWMLPIGWSTVARHDPIDAVTGALRAHARKAGPDSHVAKDAAAFEQAVAEARGYEALSKIVEALAQLGHDDLRDGTGECPFCTLGQPPELRGLLLDDVDARLPGEGTHDEGCLMAQAMACFPVHPDGAEGEQCGAAGCTKPPAYPGAIYCGAACCARAEARR